MKVIMNGKAYQLYLTNDENDWIGIDKNCVLIGVEDSDGDGNFVDGNHWAVKDSDKTRAIPIQDILNNAENWRKMGGQFDYYDDYWCHDG